MANRLVIVESPAKAKTIGKYLGRAYTVKASMGHVRDLPKSKLGVDVEHDFAPHYLIPRDKSKTVKELKASAQAAREVYLATDPDREGEAIAWHLAHATGLDTDSAKVKRVVFHEITPDAVKDAVAHPRGIDTLLVDAYQARRVLDRLVGYNISPLLWKKVKGGLSAGRVQSVALRLIVEREREIEAFEQVEYWSLDAELQKQPAEGKRALKRDQFTASLYRVRGEKPALRHEGDAQTIVRDLEGAAYRVIEVKRRETQRRPSAPFITSTLQQEASRKLNFNARRTMGTAQSLYEGVRLGRAGEVGLITYMRTDSTNVAAVAQGEARAAIATRYGAQYVPERPPTYSRKAKNAQEAHEAIRPTSAERDPESIRPHLTPDQYKLYKLIWQRFIASQMANAVLDGTTVDIAATPPGAAEAPYTFRATGSVIKFDGFLAVYREGRDEGDAADELDGKALPVLEAREPLDLLRLLPEQHFTQPPPRFSEATLVKALEELGIGRPSTYAPTLGTLQERYYAQREGKQLRPTELGTLVNDLLVQHFPDIVDTGFTSHMEEELDEIAAGLRPWVPVIRSFYDPFEQRMRTAEERMERVKIKDEPAGEQCPNCDREMVIKIGRYGKFIACPGYPECKTTKPLLVRTGVGCPECKQGEIVERKAKRGGRPFYGCERYPDCAFTVSSRPVPEPCAVCGGLQVQQGRAGGLRCIVCNPPAPRAAANGATAEKGGRQPKRAATPSRKKTAA